MDTLPCAQVPERAFPIDRTPGRLDHFERCRCPGLPPPRSCWLRAVWSGSTTDWSAAGIGSTRRGATSTCSSGAGTTWCRTWSRRCRDTQATSRRRCAVWRRRAPRPSPPRGPGPSVGRGRRLPAAAIAYFWRRPRTPPGMPAPADGGQETPAVATLLASGGPVPPDAVPAPLFGLAGGRVIQVEESQPHLYSVRIGGGAAPNLTAYE